MSNGTFSRSIRICSWLAFPPKIRTFPSAPCKSFISNYVRGRQELSTVHRGTQFEHRSRALLQEQLSMSLCRVGGKGDGGVDLQGWWWLPDNRPASEAVSLQDVDGCSRRRIRVLAQCKAERKKMGPNYIREMEGVLHRYVYSMNRNALLREADPIVALLVSESTFTKAAVMRVLSSPVPFLLIHLPPTEGPLDTEEHDRVGSALWNPALSGEDGVLKGEFELRWERPLSTPGTKPTAVSDGRPGLWWRGGKLRSWTPEEEGDGTDA